MGILTNAAKKLQLASAKSPLERLFCEAKWDASEFDLRWYRHIEEEMQKIIDEKGYTDESREEMYVLISCYSKQFQDPRFGEFLMRAFNGER